MKRNRRQAHYMLAVRGGESTMSPDDAINQILELSAEAHTKRREAAENSTAFHKLTGAVLAYGQALNLLTKLRKSATGSEAALIPDAWVRHSMGNGGRLESRLIQRSFRHQEHLPVALGVNVEVHAV